MKVTHRYNSEERQHFLLNRQYSFKLKPKLLYSGILSKQKGWRDNVHTHDFVEIMFVMEGKGCVYYQQQKREIHRGDIIIYNAGLPHWEESSQQEPLELLFIGLDKVELTGLPSNYFIPPEYEIVYPSGEMEETFRIYFSGIVDEMAGKDKFYNEIVKNMAVTLVMYVYRLIHKFENVADISAGNRTLEMVQTYIDIHFLEPISLDQIAAACHISKYYLSHLFSEEKQQTVGQYILKKRLEYAKKLLLSEERGIGEIALDSGFNDSSYFSRAFKKMYRMTPMAYRKQWQQMAQDG